LDIIDLEREDLLRVSGVGPEQADEVLRLIESLTVEEGSAEEAASKASEEELAEVRELAADIMGIPRPGSAPAAEGKANPAGDD
jgi:DNA-binding GntR family transcriptional regulator